jgi:hypothetical protein
MRLGLGQGCAIGAKARHPALESLCAQIGGHHENAVAKICHPPGGVGQPSVAEDL